MNNDFNSLFGMFTANSKEESQQLSDLQKTCKAMSRETFEDMRRQLVFIAMMKHGVEASQEVCRLMDDAMHCLTLMYSSVERAEHIVNYGLVKVPR